MVKKTFEQRRISPYILKKLLSAKLQLIWYIDASLIVSKYVLTYKILKLLIYFTKRLISNSSFIKILPHTMYTIYFVLIPTWEICSNLLFTYYISVLLYVILLFDVNLLDFLFWFHILLTHFWRILFKRACSMSLR